MDEGDLIDYMKQFKWKTCEFLNFCRQQGIFAKDICVECLRKEFGEDWALRYLNEFKGTEIEWDHCYLLVREKDIERLEKELRKLCETRWGRLRRDIEWRTGNFIRV